jgi:hypothetical protein
VSVKTILLTAAIWFACAAPPVVGPTCPKCGGYAFCGVAIGAGGVDCFAAESVPVESAGVRHWRSVQAAYYPCDVVRNTCACGYTWLTPEPPYRVAVRVVPGSQP